MAAVGAADAASVVPKSDGSRTRSLINAPVFGDVSAKNAVLSGQRYLPMRPKTTVQIKRGLGPNLGQGTVIWTGKRVDGAAVCLVRWQDPRRDLELVREDALESVNQELPKAAGE